MSEPAAEDAEAPEESEETETLGYFDPETNNIVIFGGDDDGEKTD